MGRLELDTQLQEALPRLGRPDIEANLRLSHHYGARLSLAGAPPDVHESSDLTGQNAELQRHVVDPGGLPGSMVAALVTREQLRIEDVEAGNVPSQLDAAQEDAVDREATRRPSAVHLRSDTHVAQRPVHRREDAQSLQAEDGRVLEVDTQVGAGDLEVRAAADVHEEEVAAVLPEAEVLQRTYRDG